MNRRWTRVEEARIDRKEQARRRNTTAVIIDGTLDKQEEMLKKAKERIVLSELNIKDVKFRKGRTGATIMELDGESGDDKADRLTEKLIEIGKEIKEVRIRRPCRVTEIRIRDVSSSVSRDEVMQTLQDKWVGLSVGIY